MAAFSHLLITRFNLPMAGGRGLDPEWLMRRFELFMRFCYPSVAAQTCRDFVWLLLLDARTPEAFRRRIDDLRQPWLQPCYLHSGDLPSVTAVARQHVAATSTHVISTTLDNDDAIADSFIERVQARFAGQDFQLLNFVRGFRLLSAKRKLYACELSSNPFMSLIERNRTPRTIYGCLPHSTIADRFPDVVDIRDSPSWLQVVHGGNLAPTSAFGRERVPLGALGRAGFSVDVGPRWDGSESMDLTWRMENTIRRAQRRLWTLVPPRHRASLGRALRRGRSLPGNAGRRRRIE